MATDFLANQVTNVTGMIGAVAALGTAAYGLVDTSKIFGGGVSRIGLGFIKKALVPFQPALIAAVGDDWYDIVSAHWINGMPKDDQKAVVKSLIHLGLTVTDVDGLAKAGSVDSAVLKSAIKNLQAATDLTAAEIGVLGRFDSMIDAKLDGAFERADQLYRNAAKALAVPIAIALAVGGEAIITSSATDAACHVAGAAAGCGAVSAFGWEKALFAILVGLVAVPLAPVAKDLASALQTGVKALQSVKS